MRPIRVRAWFGVVAGLLLGFSANERARGGQWQQAAFDAADGFKLHGDFYLPAGVSAGQPGHAAPGKGDQDPSKGAKPSASTPGSPRAANSGRVPFIILVHAFQSDRKSWGQFARSLNDAGFAVLSFDLRGHGDSATSATTTRVQEHDPKLIRETYDDLRGAYDWIAAQPGIDRARFAIVAAESGASIALDYAAKDKSVDAVVCLSPAVKPWGMDTRGDLRQITGRRILLVSGERDREACTALDGSCDGMRRKNCDETVQGTELLTAAAGLGDYIIDFLKTSVGEATEDVVFASVSSNIYHPADSEWVQRIKPTNLRYFSSAKEAEARGLRLTRSKHADDGDGSDSKSGGMGGNGSSGGKTDPKPKKSSGKGKTP